MTMHDGLARHLTAVHADVEPFYAFIGRKNPDPRLIEKEVDGAPLGIVKIEIGGHMAARND